MTALRPDLPSGAARQLAAFEDPAILGASRQIAIAADLLTALVAEHPGNPAEIVRDLRAVASYLIDQRGASTQAIPNALAQMLAGSADWAALPPDQFREKARAAIGGYAERSRQERDRATVFGLAVAAPARRILAYDYSSSVAAILRGLGDRPDPPAVVIPEARSLTGGRRFVEDLAETGLRLELAPDAAVSTMLADCDLALIGAETIGADGSCYNTVGSLGVALACRYWRVPLYVPSTLIKIDTRTLAGYQRPMPLLHDVRLRGLVEGWPPDLAARVAVASPDLDRVPPDLLTGFITEAGVLPPAAIAAHAARLAEDLRNV